MICGGSVLPRLGECPLRKLPFIYSGGEALLAIYLLPPQLLIIIHITIVHALLAFLRAILVTFGEMPKFFWRVAWASPTHMYGFDCIACSV